MGSVDFATLRPMVFRIAVVLIALVAPSASVAFFCPPRPEREPFNVIAGTIETVRTDNRDIIVTKNSIRIYVDGTSQFTLANDEGYFYLAEVESDNVRLRFEHAAGQCVLDLGDIGWNNRIDVEGIVLNQYAATCRSVSKKAL